MESVTQYPKSKSRGNLRDYYNLMKSRHEALADAVAHALNAAELHARAVDMLINGAPRTNANIHRHQAAAHMNSAREILSALSDETLPEVDD